MFVSSMTPEEKKAEALRDFGLITTQINMAFDTFKKHWHRGTLGSAIKRITITTKRKNTWTITFIAIQNGIATCIYAPIQHKSGNGYISLSDNTKPLVLEYTAHFMQRYCERYIVPHNVNTGKLTTLEYFMLYNKNSTYDRREDGEAYHIVSNQGYMIGRIPTERVIQHLTYIGESDLTNVKQEIVSQKLTHLNAVTELFNYPEEITTEVLRSIAVKHGAGKDFIENWEKWHSL